jgi:hypothetical protein
MNYKSLAICSHTIAASETNGDLKEFLNYYHSQCKEKPINLFQAAKFDMPRGAGNKGGVPKRRRVKKATIENPTQVTSQSTLSSQVSSSFSSAMANLHPCVSPSVMMPTSHTPFTTSCNNTLALSQQQLYSMPSTSSGMSIFPAPPAPFRLAFISGNISVCQGCRQKFPRNIDGSIIDPPYNIVIQHEEDRAYKCPSTNAMQTKRGNAYYHLYLPCVQNNWPNFCGNDIQIDDKTKEKLTQSHKELVFYNTGMFIP